MDKINQKLDSRTIMKNDQINNLARWAIINDYYFFSPYEIKKLFNKFESLENIWNAENNEIKNIIKDNNNLFHFLKLKNSKDTFEAYVKIITDLLNSNIEIISHDSSSFPQILKRIKKYPYIIYMRGTLKNFEDCVAIVGTRKLSHYGHKITRELSSYLAKKGYTIVSGLARGTDTEAHCGALDVNGKTIAVLASNVGKIYPPENCELAIDIMKNGAVISGISPIRELKRYQFVERNRVISGISKCLVAIESDGIGGTAHQVNFALEQGIKVFVPKISNKNRESYKGYKKFIKAGATSFEYPKEILKYLKSEDSKFRLSKLDQFIP